MSGLTLSLVLVYFALLVVALVRRGGEFNTPWLFLLRGLFPSWRFFDKAGFQPRLCIRALDHHDQWTAWEFFVPRAPYRFRDLFHNARNNLRLTEQTLVDHLSLDIAALQDTQDAGRLVSYRLTERLARRLAADFFPSVNRKAIQFQLRMMPGLSGQKEETVLVSPVLYEAHHDA